VVARELYNQNTLEISITICYYNITKGTTDRRLVLIVLVKKVTATIFRLDGGYFLYYLTAVLYEIASGDMNELDCHVEFIFLNQFSCLHKYLLIFNMIIKF